MTANPLEEAMRRVINDRRIFWMPQELISKTEWEKLREAVYRSDSDTGRQVLTAAKDALAAKLKVERDQERKRDLEADKALLERLEVHIQADSSRRLLELLESFGPLRANLPNIEDFGKVIEGHSRPVAEQFFLYKIQKEKDQRQRQALMALFEEVKRLYDQHVEPLEIAFFVRKVDSLTQLVEVLQ